MRLTVLLLIFSLVGFTTSPALAAFKPHSDEQIQTWIADSNNKELLNSPYPYSLTTKPVKVEGTTGQQLLSKKFLVNLLFVTFMALIVRVTFPFGG